MHTDSATLKRMTAILPLLGYLEDRGLAEKIARAWELAEERGGWDSLEQACFGPHLPKARLVDHVNAATESALRVCEIITKYQGIMFDTQLVVAIGLMHDVCKVLEYEPDGQGGARVSEIGKHLQHGVAGGMLAQEVGMPLEMVHLILTHTPQSTMQPNRIEGVLFAAVDICDANMLHYTNGHQLFGK
ncbi:hypothetical protein KL86DPRO_11191 [uncultured delta proteobacterium]|uniref:HD domain-containing protein n=1 Tax=uncultured delta proteobacterium TaxID=34034 RepID=A0A212JD12_9DELT|nr:hypothetical protein KL86DPRO_11191 [uncultured delta proteobacterium]